MTGDARYRAAEARLWQSVALAPIERTIRVPRLGTVVRVQEVGTGPPVVFVHGAMNAGASWADLLARLDGFRCLVLDRPGCGLSEPRPRPFRDLDALATFGDTFLVDVLDALGLERAPVVATSLGGYLALRGAAAHPARIDRIMEFGWPVGASAVPLGLRTASGRAPGRLMAMMRPNRFAVRSMLRRIGLRRAIDSGAFSPAAEEWYVALLRETATMRNELCGGPPFPMLRMDEHALLPASLLARATNPVHLLWGADDPFGDATVARRFAALLPDATLEVVPDAGHAVWIDEPARAAATTSAFLRGEPVSATATD